MLGCLQNHVDGKVNPISANPAATKNTANPYTMINKKIYPNWGECALSCMHMQQLCLLPVSTCSPWGAWCTLIACSRAHHGRQVCCRHSMTLQQCCCTCLAFAACAAAM